jgi:hypothetical protein
MILDADRPSGNFNLTESVALISDIVLTDTNLLTLNPPVIGTTYNGGQVWYHLSGSTSPVIVSLTTYPLSVENDSTSDKYTLMISASSVPTTGYGVSGSINTLKSYLILSGSATSGSRLRLYSRPVTEVSLAEMTRSFGIPVQDNSLLIADLVFDSASFKYPLVPILEAYTWKSTDVSVGSNETGYILQNTSAGTTDLTASLHIYNTED